MAAHEQALYTKGVRVLTRLKGIMDYVGYVGNSTNPFSILKVVVKS